MKKIYFINCTFGHGGPGDVVKNLFMYFSNKQYECRFACSRFDEKNNKFYKIGNKVDSFFHYIFSLLFDNEGFNSRIATKKLISDIKKFNPDIINVHSLVGHFINYKILFRYFRQTKAKVIWTLHDCSAFTGHCINFERAHCTKWKQECEKCPLKNDYPKSLFFDSSRKNYVKKKSIFTNIPNLELVTPSNWLKSLVQDSFLKDYKCSCIHNGIDLSVFKHCDNDLKRNHVSGDEKLLLFVAGIWNEMKGIKVVNELAKKISNRYRIVLIGKCDIELEKNIIHYDRTNNRKELVDWYSAADVFVNPTLGDNFPTVNIEALSCGTPIVTFETGGSPEVITQSTGVIVYEKNAQCLLAGIEKCINLINLNVVTKEECEKRSALFSIDHFSSVYENMVFLKMKDGVKDE